MKNNSNSRGGVRQHFAAGIAGGAASTILLHPLDLLKIRFAANDGKRSRHPQYTTMLGAFKTIVKNEGTAGLYRGCIPNLIAASSAWGVYFLVYGELKNGLRRTGGLQTPSDGIRMLQHLTAATGAGFVSLIVTNPINVVRTRLCLQYGPLTSFTSSTVLYRGTIDALQKLYQREGVKGLYKGVTPGMYGVTHGSLQFMAYEELKSRYNLYRTLPEDTRLGAVEYVLFAAMSKIFAALLTYPTQVLRTRLQDHSANYSSLSDLISRMWAREGVRGFYKGFSPYLVHVTPNICLIFVIYEKITGQT